MSCGKKAVLVAPLPPPYGGIANWTRIIISALGGDSNWETTVVDTSPRLRATEGRSLLNRVVDGFRSTLKARKALGCVIREGVSVVHITTSGSLALFRDSILLSYLAKHSVPTVYHIHFGRVPDILNSGSWEKAALLRNLALCSKVIAIDAATARALEPVVGKRKVVLTGNPVDLNEMDLVSNKTTEDTSSIVYIGWLIPTKGIAELCDAWRCIYKKFPNWKLELIGPYNPTTLEKMTLDIDDGLEITGELTHEEAMRRLATSSIAVLPSYTEGFPNFVLEAMSLGKPVVATAVGAIPEMVGDERGILIPPRNAKALELALEKLMDNPFKRQELGLKAKDFVRKNYSAEVVVDEYKKVWLEIMGKANE